MLRVLNAISRPLVSDYLWIAISIGCLVYYAIIAPETLHAAFWGMITVVLYNRLRRGRNNA